MSDALPEPIRGFLGQLEGRGLVCTRDDGPDPELFGNRVIDYENAEVRVRIVLDRSQRELRFGTPGRREEYWDEAFVRHLVAGHATDLDSVGERIAFVDEHWASIVDAFRPTRRRETERRLNEIARERQLR